MGWAITSPGHHYVWVVLWRDNLFFVIFFVTIIHNFHLILVSVAVFLLKILVVFGPTTCGDLICNCIEQFRQKVSELHNSFSRVYTERGPLARVEFLDLGVSIIHVS